VFAFKVNFVKLPWDNRSKIMTDEQMRLTRLEDAFVTLVELARTTDERLDHLSRNVNQHESRLDRLEVSFVTLVDLAQATDERLDEMTGRINTLSEITGTINTLSRVMVGLAEAQIYTQTKIAELAAELAEAGARTDAKLAELAEAGARTDVKLAELAEAQTHTDERLNALINIVERQISRNGDETSQE
jgi:chromosome segregation ATPase